MTKRVLLSLFLFNVVFASAAGRAEDYLPRDYRSVPTPAARPLATPRPQRWILANGLTVLLFRARGLSSVRMTAWLRMGNAWDPEEAPGLAQIAGKVLEDARATWPGITLDTDVRDEYTTLMLSTAPANTAASLKRLAGLLAAPAFTAPAVAWQKFRLAQSWANRFDHPEEAALREAQQRSCARPTYGRLPGPQACQRIQPEDVRRYYHRLVGPQGTVLGIWGDFDPETLRDQVAEAFKAWPPQATPPPAWPKVHWAPTPSATLIPDDRPQSWVVFGYPGLAETDPRRPALEVLEALLGRGFSSRLFNTIRSREALAYEIYTEHLPGWHHAGWVMIAGSTRADRVNRLVAAVERELASLAEHGPAPEEFARAKNMLTESRVFHYDSAAKIMERQMRYAFYGAAPDHLEKQQAAIAGMKPAQIQTLAKEIFQSGKRCLVVFGAPEAFAAIATADAKPEAGAEARSPFGKPAATGPGAGGPGIVLPKTGRF